MIFVFQYIFQNKPFQQHKNDKKQNTHNHTTFCSFPCIKISLIGICFIMLLVKIIFQCNVFKLFIRKRKQCTITYIKNILNRHFLCNAGIKDNYRIFFQTAVYLPSIGNRHHPPVPFIFYYFIFFHF